MEQRFSQGLFPESFLRLLFEAIFVLSWMIYKVNSFIYSFIHSNWLADPCCVNTPIEWWSQQDLYCIKKVVNMGVNLIQALVHRTFQIWLWNVIISKLITMIMFGQISPNTLICYCFWISAANPRLLGDEGPLSLLIPTPCRWCHPHQQSTPPPPSPPAPGCEIWQILYPCPPSCLGIWTLMETKTEEVGRRKGWET